MEWTSFVTDLANRVPHLRGAGEKANEPPRISQPIDRGARELLQRDVNAWLEYPALEVEYLVRTLNDHLSHCIDIRSKAQDLEIKALSEVMDYTLQAVLLDSLERHARLAAQEEPRLLGNTVGARLSA